MIGIGGSEAISPTAHYTGYVWAQNGLSPRGWRFVERHPHHVYVEADLPDMAERKRRALDRMDR